MYAEIILHRRLPKGLESFTYEVPKTLSVETGQIVQVPFRKKKLSGVVRKIHGAIPPYPTKTIEKTLPLILPSWQMELANWMSDFYQCSFGKVIDLFIPKNIWSDNSKAQETQKNFQEKKERFLPKIKAKSLSEIKKIVQSLLSYSEKKLILEKTPFPRKDFYQTLVKKIPKDAQVLFLFPDFFHIQQLVPGIAVFHGSMKEKEKALVWKKIRSGKIKLIAGTRAALFLPFQNLSAIVLDFEHSESYLEKHIPKYHTLEVAEKMSELKKIPLIVISSSPRVETYYTYKKLLWEEKGANTKVNIIDMDNERRKGNFGIFATEGIEKMAKNLAQQKQILLFLNRKGEAGALFCLDCMQVFRCEKCSVPLTLHRGEELRCHRCRIIEKIPKQCRKCGNVKLKPLGVGTEKAEKEIQKIFEKAKILRLDREIMKKNIPLDEKKLNSADILIATEIIDKPLHLRRLGLCIAILPDQLLNFPFFRASERAFGLLTHLRHLTKGEMIIQTLMPDHFLYHCLNKNIIQQFYEAELKTRETLSLPPYSRIQF